jgi:hypothetical protein
LFGGSFSSLVRFFIKEERISDADLQELIDMIEKQHE